LGYLEQRIADAVSIADAHPIVGQAFHGEVFAELSVDEIAPLQLLLPVPIRFDLVNENGTLLTSVACQIALSVALYVEARNATPTTHRILPDAGVHDTTFPLDVAGSADVYR